MVFGLGMDMRKTGAPTQSQPASVDSDGTCLLLKGGQHDGLGCRMPRLPKATQRYPTLPKAARWARRAVGDKRLNMSWDGLGDSRRGSLGWLWTSHGKSILLPDTSDPASRVKSPDGTRISSTGMSSRLVNHGDRGMRHEKSGIARCDPALEFYRL